MFFLEETYFGPTPDDKNNNSSSRGVNGDQDGDGKEENEGTEVLTGLAAAALVGSSSAAASWIAKRSGDQANPVLSGVDRKQREKEEKKKAKEEEEVEVDAKEDLLQVMVVGEAVAYLAFICWPSLVS